MRIPARPLRIVLACLATLAGLALASRAPAAESPADHLALRITADSTRALLIADRGALDSAHVVTRALVADARALGNRALVARALLLDAGLEIRIGHAAPVYDSILAAVKIAEASRDTSVWMWSMRLQSMAENYLGRSDVAEKLARRWLALAERTGDIDYQAWAHTMFGWLASRRGDLPTARRELEWSRARFEETKNPVGLAYTLNVLSVTLLALGEYDQAREVCQRELEVSIATGILKSQGYALSNLGAIEGRVGDPGLAIRYYRRVIEIAQRTGDTANALVAMSNLGELALGIGRVDEARQIAEEAIAISEKNRMGFEIAWHRMELANALRAGGREAEAKAIWRAVLAQGDSIELEVRGHAALGLARTLGEQDSIAAAIEVADRAITAARGGDEDLLTNLLIAKARFLLESGRAAEALAIARPQAVAVEKRGHLEFALTLWTQVARAERELGHPDEARAAIASATAAWEQGRTKIADLEFRELRGEQARLLMMESVRAALGDARDPRAAGPERTRAAFEALQRFKTRTLLERMAGPGAWSANATGLLVAPSVTLEQMQHEVLRPGELFLEYACGADTSFLFAVTRDSCRALGLPGEKRLHDGLEMTRESFASPKGGNAGEALARALGRRLLGGLDGLLHEGSELIVAADGPLLRLPFAALQAPGEDGPLLERHGVTFSPSATLLRDLRARVAKPGPGLFAWVGGERNGKPLAGAAHEAQWLTRHLRGVTAWRAGQRGAPPLEPSAFAAFGAVHFAAHSHADDQVPWRSGVVIGRAADGSDSLLTAAAIAAARLASPLVVLSSCESAGGRVRSGEGVAGLSSAFLAAGSPVVIATLWPVDDRATARLVEEFYDGLARGRSVADALRDAQQVLRDRPKFARPFFWAGFVAIGDGDRTMPIEAKPHELAIAQVALGLAVLAALLIAWRARRRPSQA